MLTLQSEATKLHIEWEQDNDFLLLEPNGTVRPNKQLMKVVKNLKRAIKAAEVMPL